MPWMPFTDDPELLGSGAGKHHDTASSLNHGPTGLHRYILAYEANCTSIILIEVVAKTSRTSTGAYFIR